MKPYLNPWEHLRDHIERVLLLIERYVLRYGYRLTDASGGLSDISVSLEEVRHLLHGDVPVSRPVLGDPTDLASVERTLGALGEHIRDRERATPPTVVLPIARLRRNLNLDDVEVDVLIAVLAFQADSDVARLMRFAWSDFTRTRPNVGFLAALHAGPRESIHRFLHAVAPDAPLRRWGFLRVVDGDSPGTSLLFAELAAPDAVTMAVTSEEVAVDASHEAALAGEDSATLDAAPNAGDATVICPKAAREAVFGLLRRGRRRDNPPIGLLVGPRGVGRRTLLRDLLSAAETPLSVVDPLEDGGGPDEIQQRLLEGIRATLMGDGLILVRGEPIESLGDEATMRRLVRVVGAVPVQTFVTCRSGELWERELPHARQIDFPVPNLSVQPLLWKTRLRAHGLSSDPEWIEDISASYRLTPGQIDDAIEATRGKGTSLHRKSLARAIRLSLGNSFGELAREVTMRPRWKDLVLPDDTSEQLRYLVAAARQRSTVFEQWNFQQTVRYGRSLVALFHGPPGTGKTMAAAVVAGELNRLLYSIDLSQVVDKYIGETEKNLGRVFDVAGDAQAVLLFDEADALLGKRASEIRSSTDRYANLQVNYLLGRIESYDGVVIMTSNMEAVMDEALRRRVSVNVAFLFPAEAEREVLWRSHVPPQAPTANDIDWRALADRFELSGGHIKNAVVRAAVMAADAARPMCQDDLIHAAEVEYRHLGRAVRLR